MRVLVHLIFYPGHEKINYFFLLKFGKRPAFFDLVPPFETSPAAAGAGVLSLKDRMAFHGGLVSVVFWKGGCKSRPDKILCVASYRLHAFLPDILPVGLVKRKGGAKFRPAETVEGLINRLHYIACL